jgi:hypothetical protein
MNAMDIDMRKVAALTRSYKKNTALPLIEICGVLYPPRSKADVENAVTICLREGRVLSNENVYRLSAAIRDREEVAAYFARHAVRSNAIKAKNEGHVAFIKVLKDARQKLERPATVSSVTNSITNATRKMTVNAYGLIRCADFDENSEEDDMLGSGKWTSETANTAHQYEPLEPAKATTEMDWSMLDDLSQFVELLSLVQDNRELLGRYTSLFACGKIDFVAYHAGKLNFLYIQGNTDHHSNPCCTSRSHASH